MIFFLVFIIFISLEFRITNLIFAIAYQTEGVKLNNVSAILND